jgi:hypothetical protein
MPLEVVRLRMKRARQLGLDYKTYATVRATNGVDIIAFLFSTNALRLFKAQDRLSESRSDKLKSLVGAARLIAVQPPLNSDQVKASIAEKQIETTCLMKAPTLQTSWSEQRAQLSAFAKDAGLKPASILLVGDTALEREWVGAGRLAGFVPSDRYFVQST